MNHRSTTAYPRLQAFALATGLLFMLLPVAGFVCSSFGFVFGVSITSFHFPIAILVDVLVCFWIVRALHIFDGRLFSGAILLFLGCLFLGSWHLIYIFDSSYDGMWYHQEAVIQFAKGWNPYKQLPAKEWGSPMGIFYDTHYPKAAWIAEAVVYQFTHRIESAKIIQVSTTLGLFFTTFSFCLQWSFLTWWLSLVIALLVGFNPVSIYQTYSFYLDGQLGAVLMCMILTLLSSAIWNSRILLWVGLILFCYLANIKFTGLVYGCVILAAYFIYLVWRKRSDWKYYLISISAAGLIGVLFLGYPTYVTNSIHNHHPLYPLMGPSNQGDDIAKIPQPADFGELNRFEKFYRATFAEPIWCRAPLSSKPKKLFHSIYDTYYFTRADFEMSGFGPFYAELFLAILVGFILLLVIPLPFKRELILVISVLVFSVFINSEAWYARYAPQFWLVGMVVLFGLMQHKYARFYSYLMLLGFLFNLFVLCKYYFKPHILESRAQAKEFTTLKKLDEPIRIIDGWPITFDVRAAEWQMPIKLVPPQQVNPNAFKGFTGLNSEWASFDTLQMYRAKLLP